ncbi:SRPBCC domain-containing protein [Paenibacillus kribbensis]|uniref:SRPBCC domain-containing protein n=1 Tax=Paenibacillus kribbensis TaxID=172713 RepID=UPI0008399BE8|nr:SRPBCC domain-containing protein [Paenibacillus kribbensis]
MSKSNELVITRTFNAPRELVFQAFTQGEHLKHWWGPKDWTLNVLKSDVRPGGIFHYNQTSAEGHVMWGKFVYREISAPERIVYTNSFSDEEGNTILPPFSQTWPLEILNTLTFTEQDGKTTLTMHGTPLSAIEEELQAFKFMHDDMLNGFVGTFDQLAEYLASKV